MWYRGRDVARKAFRGLRFRGITEFDRLFAPSLKVFIVG